MFIRVAAAARHQQEAQTEEVATHPDPIQLSPFLDTEAAEIYGDSSTT